MTAEELLRRLRLWCAMEVPNPGSGRTAERHARLIEVSREDLSLAKLVEAHWDAVAILAEAGRQPISGAIYGVWASEAPGAGLTLSPSGEDDRLNGTKRFASGGHLLDRALLTTGGDDTLLIDLDLRANAATLTFDTGMWHTEAFRLTETGAVTFTGSRVPAGAVVGGPGWYLSRPGFWNGACGPAACWAGGVLGLVDYARQSRRRDPHTLAHLGAMEAQAWGLEALLEAAGRQIDAEPGDARAAQIRALTVRHLVEQAATDILRRFGRAYGPVPLAMNPEVGRRYQEASLYLLQSHGERDLEALASASAAPVS